MDGLFCHELHILLISLEIETIKIDLFIQSNNYNNKMYNSRNNYKTAPIEPEMKPIEPIKNISNYEIKCIYKINMNHYYRNIPIYHYKRNFFI